MHYRDALQENVAEGPQSHLARHWKQKESALCGDANRAAVLRRPCG